MIDKNKIKEEELEQILKQDYFRKCYMDSGETIFYPNTLNNMMGDGELFTFISKSKSQNNLALKNRDIIKLNYLNSESVGKR